LPGHGEAPSRQDGFQIISGAIARFAEYAGGVRHTQIIAAAGIDVLVESASLAPLLGPN